MTNLTEILNGIQSSLTMGMEGKVTSLAHDKTLDPTTAVRHLYAMRSAFSKVETLHEMIREGYPEEEVLGSVVDQAHDCVRTLLKNYHNDISFGLRTEASAVSLLYIKLTSKYPHLRRKDPVADLIATIEI